MLCLLPCSSLVLHNITRGVFEVIVEQAPLAIEDLMNEVGLELEPAVPSRKPSERPPAGEHPCVTIVTCPPPRQGWPGGSSALPSCLVPSFLPSVL